MYRAIPQKILQPRRSEKTLTYFFRHELGLNNRSPNFNNQSLYQRMPPPNYRTPSPFNTPPRGGFNNNRFGVSINKQRKPCS